MPHASVHFLLLHASPFCHWLRKERFQKLQPAIGLLANDMPWLKAHTQHIMMRISLGPFIRLERGLVNRRFKELRREIRVTETPIPNIEIA